MSNFQIAVCLVFVTHFITIQDSTAILAKSNACFSATTYVTDHTFNPPYDGEIVGIRLVHDSGSVTCDYNLYAGTNWGCEIYDDWMMVQMIKQGVGVYYPTTTTDGVHSLSQYSSCTNKCTAYYYYMTNYNINSDTIEFIDYNNPYTVSTTETFSIQYSEGCCYTSTHDNSGTSCADVYFIYSDIERSYSRGPNTVNSWADGETYCENQGGTLATIETYDKWTAANTACGGYYCWIGAHDTDVEGVWEWSDGTDISSSYGFNSDGTATTSQAPWSSTEPNNRGDEDCAHIIGASTLYNDASCLTGGLYPLCSTGYDTGTEEPTTSNPTTSNPTSAAPTTSNPTTSSPTTASPSGSPTTDPTNDPSSDPTAFPTLMPSEAPTYLNCEDSGNIKHLDWSDIMDYGGDELPEISYDIDVSSKDQQISINIEADYLGHSFIDNKYGFGTTYHLGFEQFEDMALISNCDNRMESSYKSKEWSEYWTYSEYPYLNGSIGSNNFLAYPPPSKYWTIDMDVNNSCSKIKYSALFSWRNLIKCKSNDGESMAVDVDIDNEFINMSGIFFVDVLSPVSMITDIGYYYKYQLLYYPFKISIQKSIDILSSTNIFIFTASIINVGRTDEDDIFKMFLLTESALDIPLINPSLLFAPNDEENPFIFTQNQTECLSFTSNICSQIWEITANVDCPYTFSGVYAFQFGTICDGSDQNSNCENYTNIYGDIVSLSTSLIFEDLICDDVLWKFEYNAQVMFYNDSTYLTSIPNDYQFVVGEDRIYVQVIVDDFDVDYNGYSMIDTKLLNVWLCTISTNNKLTLDENNLTHTGCFSSEIDSDGPYHIIVNYNESFSNDARHEYDTFNNIVRFSFIVPDTITRDTLYIQTQLGLQFIEQDSNSRRRRRLLTSQNDQDHANQMFHHFEGVQLTIAETNEYDIDSNATQNDDDENKINDIYIAIIAALCCILLFGGICFVMVYKRKHCTKFKHNYHIQSS